MASVSESLPLTWETQMKLLVPDLDLALTVESQGYRHRELDTEKFQLLLHSPGGCRTLKYLGYFLLLFPGH